MSESMSEIARLDEKINHFMSSQDRHNEQVLKNLDKLTDAMATQQAQQIEINNLSSTILGVSNKFDKLEDTVHSIKENQAVSNEFRKQVTQMKWVIVGVGSSLLVFVLKEIIM